MTTPRIPVPSKGALLALAAAALFGASTPLAKVLLGDGVDPWLLAGILYGGSGLGLGAWLVLRRASGRAHGEASLKMADLPWLALVVLTGGVAGPVLLMVGLAHSAASTTALLLNLEGLATMAIAWLVFRENVDRRLLIGAAAILAGAVVLSWSPGAVGLGWGAAAIAGACAMWGIDNNLTRKLSSADPVQIAAIKGLAAGGVNLTLAMMRHAPLPRAELAGAGALLGLAGYGLSLVLFVLALRHLGTARTGAYFSTAPFLGAVLALALFDEPISPALIAAALLMAIGVWLHLTEVHEHEHAHETLDHSHRHTHDVHHQHDHAAGDPPGEPHSHPHRHKPLRHSHAHYPDLHHRHGRDQHSPGD
jgi:drug/metabolite transporter (DMT)-like permease